MKEFLSRKNITFTDKNVVEDPQALQDLEALGYQKVPVTLIGDQIIVGYDPEKLARALE